MEEPGIALNEQRLRSHAWAVHRIFEDTPNDQRRARLAVPELPGSREPIDNEYWVPQTMSDLLDIRGQIVA